MGNSILSVGAACVIAAIVGGGLKVFGAEIPVLNSVRRQLLLAAFGGFLIVGSLLSSKFRSTDEHATQERLDVSRLGYFSGSWRFEKGGSKQWTGGACAISEVYETLANDLIIKLPTGESGVALGHDQHSFYGHVTQDDTPSHDCRYGQSGRTDYRFTSLRSAVIRCDDHKDCILNLTHESCTGDCIEDNKQISMQYVIPESKRQSDSFVAVRAPLESVMNEDVNSYKFVQR